jgi:iron-sulfur cluster assembly protein
MDSIQFSDTAADKIRQYLEKYPNATGMRLAVNPSGCNGYAYEHNGITVFINKKDNPFLGDIVIDYIKDGFNSKFDIQNSLTKNECGCGKSFRV